MSDETTRGPNDETRPRDFNQLVRSLVHTVDEVLPPGDLAELRRLRPEQPGSPAFWKIAVGHLGGDGLRRIGGTGLDEAEKRWAALLSAIAHTRGLHTFHARLGTALFNAGFHERRFIQLLRSSGDRLLKAVSTTALFLAAKGEPFDPCDLASLVASDGSRWGEAVRRHMARTYFAGLN